MEKAKPQTQNPKPQDQKPKPHNLKNIWKIYRIVVELANKSVDSWREQKMLEQWHNFDHAEIVEKFLVIFLVLTV